MVVLSENYVQNFKHRAIGYRWYVDSREFQKILNEQNKHNQFTIDDESKEKYLNFIDIKIKNNNGRYELMFIANQL